MGFERFIAVKHLMHRRKTGFISLISLISVAGVAVGVMALIVVLAVMSGFDRELKSKIVNVQPHLRVEKFGGVDRPAGDIQKIQSRMIPGLERSDRRTDRRHNRCVSRDGGNDEKNKRSFSSSISAICLGSLGFC